VIGGLLAAIGASLGYAVATILQARGSRKAQGLHALVQPLVVVGFVLDGASFLLSLVAYASLPLFLVQSIIAASLVGVVALAVPVLHASLRPWDVAGVIAVVAGLVTLGLATGDQPEVRPSGTFVVVVLVAAAVLAVLLAAAYVKGPAWMLGTISALGYSGVAIAAREASPTGPWTSVVFQPLAAGVVLFGITAVIAYVRALERGPVSLAAALVSVIEVVIPGVVGIALFGDGVAQGWMLAAIGAVAVCLAGCVVLSFSPANDAAEG
jgi:drug/metabolite transporter (DMT)-like permease